MILNKLKLIAIWSGITAILCTVSLIYGYFWGKGSAKTQILIEDVKSVKNRDEIERKIFLLPKNEVQKLLEQKWCRDCH